MCKECGKYFVTRWHLEKHMRVHGVSVVNRKTKKDIVASAPPTTAVMVVRSEPSILPSDMKISFPPDMLVGQETVVAVTGVSQQGAATSAPADGGETDRAADARLQGQSYSLQSDHASYFLPALEQGGSHTQGSSSAPPDADRAEQQQQPSTIDKSQISINY